MKAFHALLFSLLAAECARGEDYHWEVLAGEPGGRGNADGPRDEARFFGPAGLAADGEGNLYVADYQNHTVRKISPSGEVSTLAGKAEEAGAVNGTGPAARFNKPAGVALDAAGNLYVLDQSSYTVRRVTPEGVVSTVVGQAPDPFGEGPPPAFHHSYGVTVDAAGNIYVADMVSQVIRKAVPGGAIAILAGKENAPGGADGSGEEARFKSPTDLALDHAGNLYVADQNNHTVRRIDAGGVVTTLAGGAGQAGYVDGPGAEARFDRPVGVAAGAGGVIYVTEAGNHTVRRISPQGVVTTLAGRARQYGSADGPGFAAQFFDPSGITVDGAGNVYVADFGNQTIRKISPEGEVGTVAGKAWAAGGADGRGTEARFWEPTAVTLDGAGNLYAADNNNCTVRRITPGGTVSTVAGKAGEFGRADGPGATARFSRIDGLASDGAGNLYVADTSNFTVRKITPAGMVSTLAGKAGSQGVTNGPGASARFWRPKGLAADKAGNVYVVDAHHIRKISPSGVVSVFAGRIMESGSADGPGTEARFNLPNRLTVDGAGNVYVADSGNFTIRKITPGGIVSTFAGKAGEPGSADGPVAEARFNSPKGLALDGAGNLYVTDSLDHTVRKITPQGVVSTIGGRPGVSGHTGGAGARALFNFPSGVAVDAAGNLYVADYYNNAIRRGISVSMPAGVEGWRQTHFGSTGNSGPAADGADPDGDGLVNLLEYALALDPKAPGPAPHSIAAGGDEGGGNNSFLFNYRRSTAALSAGTVFTVEWSDDPAGPWKTDGVTESVLSAEEGLESVRAALSAGPAGRRFVRLKVTAH